MHKLYDRMQRILADMETASEDTFGSFRLAALAEIADYERGLCRRPEVPVHVSILHEDAVLPVYKNPHDAGADISAMEDVLILPNETVVIRTGFSVAIPNGYELQIRPRSGLSLKTGLRVVNSPGTIDTGYRDEVGVLLQNTGKKPYHIKKHDRVAQMVLAQVPKIYWEVCSDVQDIPGNRGGGFGSTG